MGTLVQRLLLISAFVVSSLACADDKEFVLVGKVPQGASDSQVLRIVRQSLLNRKWNISADDGKSIFAEISRNSYDSKIKVYISGTSVLYTDSSTRKDTREYPPVIVPTAAPEKWINNLRADIAMLMATIPEQASAEVAQPSPASAVERLRALKDMLDGKLITQDEYDRKKAEILHGL